MKNQSLRVLAISLTVLISLFINSCKKCDDHYAENHDKRGDCEYPEPSGVAFGFTFDGQNFVYDNNPQSGGIWNGIGSDWNAENRTTLSSWLNMNWNNQSWSFNIEIPIDKVVNLKAGDDFTLETPTSCPDLDINASATISLWDADSSKFDSYATTSSTYSGILNISKVTDGAIYNHDMLLYIDGSFNFSINIDGTNYQVTNGFFSNAEIIREH